MRDTKVSRFANSVEDVVPQDVKPGMQIKAIDLNPHLLSHLDRGARSTHRVHDDLGSQLLEEAFVHMA